MGRVEPVRHVLPSISVLDRCREPIKLIVYDDADGIAGVSPQWELLCHPPSCREPGQQLGGHDHTGVKADSCKPGKSAKHSERHASGHYPHRRNHPQKGLLDRLTFRPMIYVDCDLSAWPRQFHQCSKTAL